MKKLILILSCVLFVLCFVCIVRTVINNEIIFDEYNGSFEPATQLISSSCSIALTPIEELQEEKAFILEEKVQKLATLAIDKEIKNEKPQYTFNDKEVELLAKLVWGEAMGLDKLEQSAVIWCVLNRVDSQSRLFPDTIKEVILQPNQFSGYHKWCPVKEDIVDLVKDVLTRWYMEKDGIEDVGRTLPKDYYFFRGFSKHNWFFTKSEYNKAKLERNYWDWSLENPYV